VDWRAGKPIKPRILVLEVCDRRDTEDGPIAWLFVERQETYRLDERDSSIYEASITLSYEVIGPRNLNDEFGRGSFGGRYSRSYDGSATVSLIAGAVFLDPPKLRGQRVGTYLMSEIVAWAKQWPDAVVLPIELVEGQAQGENKDRRNRFYERYGLVFEYCDETRQEGISKPTPISSLTLVESWKKKSARMECS
jgi:GNAT superfamily N-acetyltransferase